MKIIKDFALLISSFSLLLIASSYASHRSGDMRGSEGRGYNHSNERNFPSERNYDQRTDRNLENYRGYGGHEGYGGYYNGYSGYPAYGYPVGGYLYPGPVNPGEDEADALFKANQFRRE